MKKIITIITLIITTASFAQMKVTNKKDEPKPELIGEYKILSKSQAKLEKKGDVYIFTYRDQLFTTRDEYKHFLFRSSDFDAFYDLLTNFEGIEKGEEKTVDLEDGGKLSIEYKKLLGQMYVRIVHVDEAAVGGAVIDLEPKKVNKIFGKDGK